MLRENLNTATRSEQMMTNTGTEHSVSSDTPSGLSRRLPWPWSFLLGGSAFWCGRQSLAFISALHCPLSAASSMLHWAQLPTLPALHSALAKCSLLSCVKAIHPPSVVLSSVLRGCIVEDSASVTQRYALAQGRVESWSSMG